MRAGLTKIPDGSLRTSAKVKILALLKRICVYVHLQFGRT